MDGCKAFSAAAALHHDERFMSYACEFDIVVDHHVVSLLNRNKYQEKWDDDEMR